MATAEREYQKLVFSPANRMLVDFLDELQKLAKDAFGLATHAIIEKFIYVRKPPNLNKSMTHAHLEEGRHEQIITHFGMEMELNGLEAPAEPQFKTVCQHAANTKTDPLGLTCHHCKKQALCRNQCRSLKKQGQQTESTQSIP